MNRRQARAARRLALLVLEWRRCSTDHRRELLLGALPWRYLTHPWVDAHMVRPAERIRARRYWR